MVLESSLGATGLTDLELAAAEAISDLRALYRVARDGYFTGQWDRPALGVALVNAAYLLGEDTDQYDE